jgi:serine/threonine protein kinase
VRLSEGDNLEHGPAARGYQILGVLAQGDTGVVYRATETVVGREVVVKALHERFAPDSEAARRFVDAARIMGQLQHPGIPAVHAFGTLPDGRPFFVMKLIRGRTLEEVLDTEPDLAAERGRLLAVFEQVCQTVGYAHCRRVAHRSLNLEHIMIGAFGEVQVLGWGAAGVFAGSPPEEADGSPAGCRSDVFSLGEMLCTILTGRGGAAERLEGCGADPQLVALARRCLSPDPAGRPLDAGAVAGLVASCRAAAEERLREAEAARVAAVAVAAEQRKRRSVQLALAVAVVLLIAACVALVMAWGG